MDLHHAGDSVFVDKSPLDEGEIQEALTQDWSPKFAAAKVHPFVRFTNLEHAYYGLSIHLDHPGGGPKSWANPPVVSVDVGHMTFENIAPLTDFKEALKLISEGSRGMLEEFPFSEIETEAQYNQAAAASLELRVPKRIQDWSPSVKSILERESLWRGSGVYDMRDVPPSLHNKSVEEYETQSMEYEAGETLDYMFQGDEWKGKLRELFQEYRESLS